MPKFLNTFGKPKLSIAVCARCNKKVAYSDLRQDEDKPGLWVCEPCVDEKDPWRLPPRQTEDISLKHPRPDESIVTGDPGLMTNPYDSYVITDENGNPLVP